VAAEEDTGVEMTVEKTSGIESGEVESGRDLENFGMKSIDSISLDLVL
jgi:hypothetical protein